MDMPFCCPLPAHFSSPCLCLVRNPGERTRVESCVGDQQDVQLLGIHGHLHPGHWDLEMV